MNHSSLRIIRWAFILSTAVRAFLPAAEATAKDPPRAVVAPVERDGFTRLTSYESLQSFLADLAGGSGARVDVLARTLQGRSVSVVELNPAKASAKAQKLKILLFAQQHGDEPSGKEAMTMLLARWVSGHYAKTLQHIELRIVPQMNPDGSELRQRRTSAGIDLNRSHLILSSPETAGLHELFFAWRPQVTLDVHEFGAYGESWVEGGYVKGGDVQLGMLTNFNSSHVLREYQHNEVYPFIASRMTDAGYRFHEYIVGSPKDRIRHSTTEINDGRQSFGILGTLSFIQEGRQGKTQDGNLERRVRSQLTAIEALLEFCDKHAREIRNLVAGERSRLPGLTGTNFALRMEHVHGEGTLKIPVTVVPGERDSVGVVGPYHDLVRPVCSTTVPSGYCIPAEERAIIDLLRRHHVKMETVATERSLNAETWSIDSVGADVLEEDSLPRPFVRRVQEVVSLKPGDVVISTAQWHSLFLATMLEPESMWGVTKYGIFAGLLEHKRYPILRIP